MSEIKVLFIGDIVGKAARKAVCCYLAKLKNKYQPDLIVANGENLAHGIGMTLKTTEEMMACGIDFFTSGNHVFDKKDIIAHLKKLPIIRPENYPKAVPGRGYEILKIGKSKMAIVNLLGRVFTKTLVDCPFRSADKVLRKLAKEKVKLILVDMHAEASAEKSALFHYLNGKVSAVLGTHTHVQTADAEISREGTAFITDVGAVYAEGSVIGVEKEAILEKFLTAMPKAHEIPESGKCVFNAVFLQFDSKTGKAKKIEPIYEIV